MARKIMDDAQIERVARDFHDAGLTDAEVAMMEFAEKVCGDSAAMTEADSQTLRDHGFSDRDIVDITLAAAVRNYYSRALQALAVPLDVPPTLPEPLREALRRPLTSARRRGTCPGRHDLSYGRRCESKNTASCECSSSTPTVPSSPPARTPPT